MKSLAIFDIGETLVKYDGVSLNWSEHYEPALQSALQKMSISCEPSALELCIAILEFYNTRIRPRLFEVSESEVLTKCANLHSADPTEFECAFFSYFQRKAKLTEDAAESLRLLKASNVHTAALTDVPYGMPKSLILRDIEDIEGELDTVATSCEMQVRKPHPRGIQLLAKQFSVHPDQVLYIGNEQKDVHCAKNAGVWSVLYTPSGVRSYGQSHTISKLTDVVELLL